MDAYDHTLLKVKQYVKGNIKQKNKYYTNKNISDSNLSKSAGYRLSPVL